MNICGIIQVRLENVVDRYILEKIIDRRLIEYTIQNIKKIKKINSIIIACPSAIPPEIETIAKQNNVDTYFGSKEINRRFLDVAKKNGADIIVRFTGDLPFLDIELTEHLIESHIKKSFDFSKGMGFPQGTLPDIISTKVLEKLLLQNISHRYVEYIDQHSDQFHVNFLKTSDNLKPFRYDVKTKSNLVLTKKIFTYFKGKIPGKNELLEVIPNLLNDLVITSKDLKVKREYNKLLNDFEYSNLNTSLYSFPPAVRIDTSNICNIKCETCVQKFDRISDQEYDAFFSSSLGKNISNLPIFFKDSKSNYYKKKFKPLSMEMFNVIFKDLYPYSSVFSFGVYGEPLMNKNIFSMLYMCRDKGIKTSIITNGTLLDKNVNKKIIETEVYSILISIDGAKKETYEKIRKGAKFDKLIKNIENLSNIKKVSSKFEIQFCMTVSRENIDELPDLIDLGATLGIDSIVVLNRYILDFMNPSHSLYFDQIRAKEILLKSSEKAKTLGLKLELSEILKKIMGKPDLSNTCPFPWNQVYISSVGTVHLCGCSGTKSIGELMKDTFKNIWCSKDFKQLRLSMKTRKSMLPECDTCLTGLNNSGKVDIKVFMSEIHIPK